MIRSLHHVGLTLPEPQEAADFYTAFGLETAQAGTAALRRAEEAASGSAIPTGT